MTWCCTKRSVILLSRLLAAFWVFATLALAAFAMGKGDESGILAATQVYFWARLVHFPAVTFGLPGIRTLAFLAGFGAQIVVALRIFS